MSSSSNMNRKRAPIDYREDEGSTSEGDEDRIVEYTKTDYKRAPRVARLYNARQHKPKAARSTQSIKKRVAASSALPVAPSTSLQRNFPSNSSQSTTSTASTSSSSSGLPRAKKADAVSLRSAEDPDSDNAKENKKKAILSRLKLSSESPERPSTSQTARDSQLAQTISDIPAPPSPTVIAPAQVPAPSNLTDQVTKKIEELEWKKWRQDLLKHPRGSEDFMRIFMQGEPKYLNEGPVKVKVWKDGHNYIQKLGDFEDVHLFKCKDGLEMVIPNDLSLKTVDKYIDVNAYASIIDSRTRKTEDLQLLKFLKNFETSPGKREKIQNMLSLEFGLREEELDSKFSVPGFVSRMSMVRKLESRLTLRKDGLTKKMEKMKNGTKEKSNMETELASIVKMLKTMPRYKKFLLVSMEEAFTDVHVDFSATSVFYHVKQGSKIFYVAKPTAENLQIYKDFELKRDKNKWIGEALMSEWNRLEIKEGETAMIPSGYIHFVYTPKDSVVIGGNFLMEKYSERQFEMTALEELCISLKTIDVSETYEGFNNLMWAFAENCLNPELKKQQTPTRLNELLTMGSVFDTNLKVTGGKRGKWFTREEQSAILTELRDQLSRFKPEEESTDEPLPRRRATRT